MSEQDPLLLLRTSISASLPAVLLTAASDPCPTLPLSAYVSFPQPNDAASINIPKDTPTRYTSKADSKDDFYTIGALWLAWTERETGVREYLMKGQAAGTYVGIADRRAVVEYLSGESDGAGRVLGKAGEAAAEDKATSSIVESLPAALEASAEAGPSKPIPTKRVYEVDVADREFCKKMRADEVELRDRTTVLRTSGGGKVNVSHLFLRQQSPNGQNFSVFLQTVMSPKIREMRSSMTHSSGSKVPPPTTSPAAYDPSRGAKKAKSSNPIIMISSSPTALVTMWNVKKFLEQGVFEPSETARQREMAQGNTRAEDVIPVIRKRTGPNGEVTQKYYIVDGVEALQKFGQDAWDRVICVLTTGQSWQFKPYKWQDPRILFRNVKGVYFQWNNEPPNPTVRDWNVQEMRIDRAKRHVDRQVVADFWRILDSARRR